MINDIVHIVISFLHIKATKIESGEKYEKRFCYRGPLSQCNHVRIFQNYPVAGAIIGDEDRKSWDPRGPMIWDNFSIFRTNCAILTSYIHARVVGSLVYVVTLHDKNGESCEFSQ